MTWLLTAAALLAGVAAGARWMVRGRGELVPSDLNDIEGDET